ncbi:MAG: hypothetical protein AB9919_13195 [Geobacteraceae bacterium]
MKTKRKLPAKRREEYSSYIIEITNSEMSYSFSLNKYKKLESGPHSEYMIMEFTGNVLCPAKIAGRTMKCRIRGDRENVAQLKDPNKYADYAPRLVGFIEVRKERADFYGWIPFGVLPHIYQYSQSGGIRFLNLHGTTLYRNNADIHSIGFQKDFDPDEDV